MNTSLILTNIAIAVLAAAIWTQRPTEPGKRIRVQTLVVVATIFAAVNIAMQFLKQ